MVINYIMYTVIFRCSSDIHRILNVCNSHTDPPPQKKGIHSAVIRMLVNSPYVLIRPAQTNIKYLSTKLNTLVGWAACHTEQHLAFIQCKYNVQERDLL